MKYRVHYKDQNYGRIMATGKLYAHTMYMDVTSQSEEKVVNKFYTLIDKKAVKEIVSVEVLRGA